MKIASYKHPLQDKVRDPKVIEKIANSNRGKKRTPEQCLRNGNAKRGRVQSDAEKLKRSKSHIEHNKKHKRSAEHIRNNAESNYKPVYQYDLNGIFIQKHISVKHAANHVNVTSSTISGNINGSQHTCKGYIFKQT